MVRFDSSRLKINKGQKIIRNFFILLIVTLTLTIAIFSCKVDKSNYDFNVAVGDKNTLDSENGMQTSLNTNMEKVSNVNNNQNISDNIQTDKNIRSSYVVMEGSRNIMLDYQNATAKLPMASTTKVMTAYIACISGKLNDIVTIPKSCVGIEGSSVYIKEGEKYKLIDLVYGLMLQSGNDAAEAIARYLGGSVEGFAKMMNEQVSLMGLKNTNFVTPHGLHDDNHYTSAYDLAYITCEALKNADFAEIVKTKVYKFQLPTGENKCYINKNKLLNLYDGCIGVKTGYTKKAGRCLVSAAERNGVKIVSVVLNQYDMWNLSMNNLNKGFSQTHSVQIAKANEVFAKVETPHGQILNLSFVKDINYTMLKNETLNLTYDIVLDKKLPEQVKSGSKVGEIKFFNDKHLIFTEKIYTI